MPIKPRLGQERAGRRCKIKTQSSKPIVQAVEKPLKNPKVPKTQDKVTSVPNFTMPPMHSKGILCTNMIDRKMIQDIAREIPIYPDPVYRSPHKPEKLPVPESLRNLWDINSELTINFEDNSPFQEGIISEM